MYSRRTLFYIKPYGRNGREIRSVNAVSYTHLDVYKRQSVQTNGFEYTVRASSKYTLANIKEFFFEQLDEEITKVVNSREHCTLQESREKEQIQSSREIWRGNRGKNGERLIDLCTHTNLKGFLKGFYQ